VYRANEHRRIGKEARGRAVSRSRQGIPHLSRQVGLFSYRRSPLRASLFIIGDDVLQPGERFLLERRGPGFGPDNSLIFQRSGNLSDTEDPRRE
jgi:hypothetical protein